MEVATTGTVCDCNKKLYSSGVILQGRKTDLRAGRTSIVTVGLLILKKVQEEKIVPFRESAVK